MTDNDTKKPIKTQIFRTETHYWRPNRHTNYVFENNEEDAWVDAVVKARAQGDTSLSFTVEDTAIPGGECLMRVFTAYQEEKENDDG